LIKPARHQPLLYEGEIGYRIWGHITQEAIHALPNRVGVYLFYGENTLPLYVGKSVNIRSRVLSHFRDRSEANMMRQVKRISFELSAGEIGALLRESQLVKQYLPLFNIRLRRKRELYSYILQTHYPKLVQSRDITITAEQILYGMFASKYAAEKHLRYLAAEHRLCLGILGLEKLTKHGCFNLQLKKCDGVCVGKEALEEHSSRLVSGLEQIRMQAWPYSGAIGIIEQQDTLRQIHWINNWCYLGSTEQATLPYSSTFPTFELDTYKILSKAILNDTLTVISPEEAT
jgi:excinuclease Cho